jgi:predicted Zn-dependent protease
VGLAPITVGGNTTSGISVDDVFSYNGSGVETGFQEDWYLNSTEVAYANFHANGGYINGDDGGALEDDGGYGDGGEFELTSGATATGSNVLNISQFDSTLPQNATATQDAQAASQEITLISQSPPNGPNSADQALYEGAKWSSNVITWSLANSPGSADSPFSSYMGSQYEALVQQALQAWGAASGLTFQQVSDSSQSDIRIGWGDFNTASSGVVGYTTYQGEQGQLQQGVIIRLEDPSQDPILTGGSSLNSSATQAYLYQAILHEIGHALGLADNNDPSSVMYYQAGASNTTLDSNDIAGIQTLYGLAQPSATTLAIEAASPTGSGTSVNSMLQQLVQANASFLTQPASAALSTSLTTTAMTIPTLVAPSSAH